MTESSPKDDQAKNKSENTSSRIDAVMRQILDTPAYERLMNIKIVKGTEFYTAVAQQLIAYYQRYRMKLSDAIVRKILMEISNQTHRDYKIKFVRR